MTNQWKLDDEGLVLLSKMEKITSEVIAPSSYENDANSIYPREALNAMKEANLLSLMISKEDGGHGQGIRTAASFVENIAKEDPSTAMVVMMHFSGAAVINQYGTEALKYAISKEDKITTLAFSESGSRSHFWLPVSSAKKIDETIELNAQKQLITSAGEADLYVWSSKPASAEGLSSLWVVPAESEGLSIPKPYNGLGLRSNSSAPITASKVIIPASYNLGEDGKGFDVMMGTVMPYFSFQNAAVSLGMMEGVLKQTIKHVSTAKFSYDGTGIREIPQVRNYLAKMKVKIDMVRGLLLIGLDSLDNNNEDAMVQVLQAKVAAAEASLEVHDMAMRVCGGAAFRKDLGIERFFRDSRAASIMAPVSDALYDFIGKAITGMDVF